MILSAAAVTVLGHTTRYAAYRLAEHVIDNHVRDTVDEPAVGSPVYCDLVFGSSEHSGIYIGNGQIIHLNRKGEIETVTPEEFVSGTTAQSIYVPCRGDRPVSDPVYAERAIIYQMGISRREYNVIMDNCHQFSAACLTGDPENSNNFLWMLKHECKNLTGADQWRVWEKPWNYKRFDLTDPAQFEDLEALDDYLSKLRKISFELMRHSMKVNSEYTDHTFNMPVSGWFLESRTEKWESKNRYYEQKIDAYEKGQDYLNKRIDELIAVREEIEKEMEMFGGIRPSKESEAELLASVGDGMSEAQIELLLKYAQCGYEESQLMLGCLLWESNHEQALELINLAASKGLPNAYYMLAEHYLAGNDLRSMFLAYFFMVNMMLASQDGLNEDGKELQQRVLTWLSHNNVSPKGDFEEVFMELVANGAMDRPGGNLLITLAALEKQLP
jgi:hypothetical protein